MKDKPVDRIMNRYFDSEITIVEANDEIIEYLEVRKFDKKTIARLDRRRDVKGRKGRTYAEFFRDISKGIRKEHAIFLKWVEYMEEMEFVVKWEKYGTDAVGLAFVENSDDRPDYLISINLSPFFPVDVKTCPILTMNTFKKGDLKNYARVKSSMLVCMGDINIQKPVLKSFVFYGPNAIRVLKKYNGRIYYEFAPNKKAVRVSYKKILESKKAMISFEELLDDNLIDIVDANKKEMKFNGPLKHLIDGNYMF